MKYKFFDHTADSKFRAYGKTLEEQFANAAEAMTSIMFKVNELKDDKKHAIYVKAKDEKQLLYLFLEEILFLMDTKKFICKSVDKIKIKKVKSGFELKATVDGCSWKESFEQKSEVKAATYAEMEITKEYVQVVVDI